MKKALRAKFLTIQAILIHVIETVVGGGEQYLICSENCMNSYDVSTSTKYKVS